MNVVVLAAGIGKRMRSELPKVLHRLAGRPLLAHVLDTARSLNPRRLVLVYGHGGERVRQALPAADLRWVLQEPQLGTGHAVMQALPLLDRTVPTMVLYGDVPLIRAATLARLAEAAEPARTAGGFGVERLESLLTELVADLEKSAPYASALYTEASALQFEAQGDERRTDVPPVTAGVVFRAYDGRSFHEMATAVVTTDAMRRTVRRLKEEAGRKGRPLFAVGPGPELVESLSTPGYIPREEVSLDEWRGAAEETYEQLAGMDPRVRSTSVTVAGSWYRTIFVDRNRQLRQSIMRSGVRTMVFGSDGEARGRAFYGRRVQGGLAEARLGVEDVAKLTREFDKSFGAGRIPPGSYRVVLAPPVTGLLAHESFGHGVEYDMFIKGRARAAQFLGKRVAPEWVQIWDDPSYPGQNGSYFHDDEGWSATATQIVKDGVFVQPITDQYSAAVGKMKRTANGRRQDYSHKAYARMSNTFFGKGETPAGEILAAAGDGVLLDGFGSGMEDPHGWGIQLMCRMGYEFKEGELTGRVFAPITVTGYVPDIL
ncbi:MAG: NTP transferase domain-containing protein, partial [Burkholderiales bacterium]